MQHTQCVLLAGYQTYRVEKILSFEKTQLLEFQIVIQICQLPFSVMFTSVRPTLLSADSEKQLWLSEYMCVYIISSWILQVISLLICDLISMSQHSFGEILFFNHYLMLRLQFQAPLLIQLLLDFNYFFDFQETDLTICQFLLCPSLIRFYDSILIPI